jgi:hypothetical protein
VTIAELIGQVGLAIAVVAAIGMVGGILIALFWLLVGLPARARSARLAARFLRGVWLFGAGLFLSAAFPPPVGLLLGGSLIVYGIVLTRFTLRHRGGAAKAT